MARPYGVDLPPIPSFSVAHAPSELLAHVLPSAPSWAAKAPLASPGPSSEPSTLRPARATLEALAHAAWRRCADQPDAGLTIAMQHKNGGVRAPPRHPAPPPPKEARGS